MSFGSCRIANSCKTNFVPVFGKLTDDHLDVIDGRRIELAGKIQEAYGISKDEAEKQIKQFEDSRPN